MIIDCDRHVIEPMGMWREHLPAAWQDGAPVLVDQAAHEPLRARLARLGPLGLEPLPPVPMLDGELLQRGFSEHAQREIAKLTERLSGLALLSRKPDLMVIVDTKHEAHATREAKAAGIPVIGIMSSDCDVKDAAYPIVVNDASKATIDLVLGELAAAYESGLKG